VDANHPPLDLRREIQADGPRIPQDLRTALVQRQHETPLVPARAFGDVLQGHDALANARHSHHERGTAREIPAVHELVETWNTGRHPRSQGGRAVEALRSRRLHAAEDLDPAAIDDPERVTAHLAITTARFHDFY